MGLSEAHIAEAMAAIAATDPLFAKAAAAHGAPQPRIRPRGYRTLLSAIVSQQVSTAAAASIWRRVETAVGDVDDPKRLLAIAPEALRAAGLSRMKVEYAQSLAGLVVDGSLPLAALPDDDEEAITLLTSVRGLGRWSAEIYLLFAEGRADIWPAGDLAVQAGLAKLLSLEARPSEKQTRELAESWRPHRGATAIFTWHCYNNPAL